MTQAAFVELHCWNVGVPGGLVVPDDYWVFMGSKQNHERMTRIVNEVIVPATEAARRAGVATVHVQPESVASRYPRLRPSPQRATPSPSGSNEEGSEPSSPEVRQRRSQLLAFNHAVERAERVHGRGYMSWYGSSRLDVAPALKPQAGDIMVASTGEFQRWLQQRGITTLIYTGFCTNLCILDSPAAMKAMNGLGYRCVLLREGTMAVEFSDQPPNIHTEAALRYIEAWVGYTASVDDFLRALKSAMMNSLPLPNELRDAI